jgi:hypothetical protein
MSCDIIAHARAAACAETDHPARCNTEWPLMDMRYALFPKAWYKERTAIAAAYLSHPNKRPHMFCYIGRSSRHKRMNHRVWIEEWASKHFDNTSIFVYTDVNRSSRLVGTERSHAGDSLLHAVRKSHTCFWLVDLQSCRKLHVAIVQQTHSLHNC